MGQLEEEIRITVIATGFDENQKNEIVIEQKPVIKQQKVETVKPKEEVVEVKEEVKRNDPIEDDMEIPTFLRRRR